jgi:hypothetical protein
MQSQVLFPLLSPRVLSLAIRKNKKPRGSSRLFCRPENTSPSSLIVARRTGCVNLYWDTQPFFVVRITTLWRTADNDERTNHGVESNGAGRSIGRKSVSKGVQKQLDSDHSQSELS